MSVRESCWMLVSAFLFALMALFAKLSTAYYGVMEIIFYRSVLGVLFVGAQMAARHISFRPHFVSHHIARCLVGTLSISLGVYVLGGSATRNRADACVYKSAFLLAFHRDRSAPRR